MIAQEFKVIFVSGEESVVAPAFLLYRPEDPYAVNVKLGALLFSVSREVLTNGGGTDRINVQVADEWVAMTLVGQHSIVFRKSELEKFALKTLVLVPFGTESNHVDWDREMANLGLGES